MSQQEHQRRIEEVIARGKALTREAHLVLERSRRQLNFMGIDPHADLERLRRDMGEEAFAQAQAEVQQMLDVVETEIKRDAMHARPSGGAGRHVRLRIDRV